MKKAFNAECDICRILRPNCAEVFFRCIGKATVYVKEPTVLCEQCRKANRGKYRLDEDHK